MRPPRLWPAGHEQRRRQRAEHIGFWTGGGESKAHTARGLDYTRGDLQKPQPQRRELGFRQIARARDRVAHAEHQPIGGRVQDEANLIGERRTA